MSQHTFENEFQSFEQLPNYCSFCGSKFLINDTHCQKCNKMRIQKRTSKQQPQVRWKKVLYEKQPYEDNYLDETFLSSLISQDSPARLTYPEVVLKAMEVSLATTFVALYLMIYRSMLEEWVDSKIIVAVHLIAVFPLLMLSMFLSPKITKVKKIFLALKEGGVGILFLFILSPLLETLFKNYASNTTYAISCGLILLHLFFRDYSYVYSTEDNKLNIDWSTLAVMFLTVILGSRLQGVIQVFTLWIASLTLFVFSRMLQKSLRAYSPKFYNYLSLALIIGMGIFLYQVSKIVIIAFLLVNFIIFFVGPLALVWFYQYKNVIHGPWDIPDVAQLDE